MAKTQYELRQKEGLWASTTQTLSSKMKRIVNDKVLNHIGSNPYDSEYLKGELEGLRSYNKLKSDSRIVFAICEECRKNGFEEVNNCADCGSIQDRTVILWAFGGHDIYKWLGRRRKKAWKKAKKKQIS